MSHDLLAVRSHERVERSPRHLVDVAGASDCGFYGHHKADDALCSVRKPHSEPDSHIAPDGFRFAGIDKKLLTPEGVDLPRHCHSPMFVDAAARHANNLTASSPHSKQNRVHPEKHWVPVSERFVLKQSDESRSASLSHFITSSSKRAASRATANRKKEVLQAADKSFAW